MKSIAKTIIGIIFIDVMICSCNNLPMSPNNNDGEVIDISSAVEDSALFFSSYMDTPKVIILETSRECLIHHAHSMDVYHDHIYILDDQAYALYEFDMDGTFIGKIGDRGNGRGEYVELSDFSIDRDNGVIYLWDEAKDIAHKFDLQTRKYISSVNTKRNGHRSYYMQFYDDKLYLNRTSMDDGKSDYELEVVDVNTGEIIEDCLSTDEYNKGWNYPLRLPFSMFYCKNTSEPKFIEMFADKIVSITKDGLSVAYTVKSPDFVTDEDIRELKKSCSENNFLYDLAELYSKKRVYQISRYIEFGNKVAFQYMKGEEKYQLIYDTVTRETRISPHFVNDYIYKKNFIPTDLCYSDDNGVWAMMDNQYFPYFIDNLINDGLLDSNIDQYERLKSIDYESNPILFCHKVK